MQPVGDVAGLPVDAPGETRAPGPAGEEIEVNEMTRTIARNRFAATLGATAGVLAAGLALGVVGPASAATAVDPTDTNVAAATAADPTTALLRASQMPKIDQERSLVRVARREGLVSNAQPGPLSDLGATALARRDFAVPGTTSAATSLVLTFDSAAEAADAYAEVRSWRRHTGDNVPAGGRAGYTSRHTPVSVESGRGSYFSFSFMSDRSSVEGTFEWLGVTRREKSVSVVAWRVDGTDATYLVDPTVRSVKIANRKLARLG